MAPLDTIAHPVSARREIERSRFLATLHPVADDAGAAAVIAALRQQHRDARHHATALVLGPDGAHRHSSDDGEPAGTAGAPLLSVLTGAGLTDVVAVVTRWFGGKLLGAGGLVRAYGGTLSDAVALAPRLTREPVVLLEVVAPLPLAGRLEHELHRLAAVHPLQVAPGRYTAERVTLPVTVPPGEPEAAVRAHLAGLAPRVTVHVGGTGVREVPAGR
ncbi:MAG: IMPACT family protein [Nitriliruptoraceae bacterium]